jgi:DNA-directed RNA polymerase specialized sigma24 family protein
MTGQKALWKRIRAGGRQEFEAFYYAHVGSILQFLCRMTGNRQVSEDISMVADAFRRR